jgi:hypothetical protein
MNSPISTLAPALPSAPKPAHPAAAPPVIVEETAFTLVEDDDVTFALSLCREIYRIYGTYLDGELTPTEPVRSGLILSMDMFATLQGTVTRGMPAMRLAVAAAQAREMATTLFGQSLPAKKVHPPGRIVSRQPAAQVAPAPARQLEPRTRVAPAAPPARNAAIAPAAPPAPTAPTAPTAQPVAAAPAEPAASEGTAPQVAGKAPHRLTLAWRRQSVVVKVLATLLACALLAVAIDIPVAILALFPSLVVPLSIAMLAIGYTARKQYRSMRPPHGRAF